MAAPAGNGLIFQVDHLSSVTCDVTAITPETLLTDFIRRSSTGTNVGQSMICDILVEPPKIYVVEKPTHQTIESWTLTSVRTCKSLPIQPAVFPNRYNNVLSITTNTEIHLFNVSNMDATKVAEAINKELASSKSEKSVAAPMDLNNVDFAMESHTLNRCFDDIEGVINRIQQNSLEYQRFVDRWNDSANAAKKGKSAKQKDEEKRRASELALITSNQVKSEDLMDTLQKVKLAFIIVGRIRHSLHPPSATGPQYVNLLLSPLVAIVSTTNQPPFSAAAFDFVKSIDAPLFRRDILTFIQSSMKPAQLDFWKQLGDPWNIPLEEWPHEVRPYRPVFRPDNYSPYLSFLDPAVIAVSLADAKDDVFEHSDELTTNVVYGLAGRAKSPNNETIVRAEVEPGQAYSTSSESRPPQEIQELDDVIAAADFPESVSTRPRPFSDSEYIDKLFSQNRRVVRANTSYQARDLTELTVDDGEVLEVVDVAGGSLILRNIFGETGRAPSERFDEIPNNKKTNLGPDSTSKLQRSGVLSSSPKTSRTPSVSTTASTISGTNQSDLKNLVITDQTISSTVSSLQAQKNNTSSADVKDPAKPSAVTVQPAQPVVELKNEVQAVVLNDESLSETESSVQSRNSQFRPPPLEEDAIPQVILQPKAVSEDESENEVAEPVPMKPKPTPSTLAIPEKDYDAPPVWLKPGKQNAFAASIKTVKGRVVSVTRAREARRSEEIDIYLDEILELLESPVGAWWRVRNAGGYAGYVPLNCLQEMEFIEPNQPRPPKQPEPEPKKTAMKKRQAKTVPIAPPPAPAPEPRRNMEVTTKVVSKPHREAETITNSAYSNRAKARPVENLDYSFSRIPKWSQSQPELVIVEQSEPSHNNRFARRRGSQNGADSKPPFGAPLLAPFSSKSRFDEARQKAASVLSLMISSQATRITSSTGLANARRTSEGSTSGDVTLTSLQVAVSRASEQNNSEDSNNKEAGDVCYQGVTVSDVVSESAAVGVYVKRQQVQHSLRYNDLQHIRENMDRLRGELNSKAAAGQLRTRKQQKLLELQRRPKQERVNLQVDSTADDVKKYLMQCGFTPQLVTEFGSFTGEQLMSMTQFSDFERDRLQSVDTRRLFNLVQGARALNGVTIDRNVREEFETKVTNRRTVDPEKASH